MAEWRTGAVVGWQSLTSSLATFRLVPEPGTHFPTYEAGQYIAIRRDHCRLTQAVLDAQGEPHSVPELDAAGRQEFGPVTHPYSIASAPFETAAYNHLEFYIVLEIDVHGAPGRLSSSLFEMDATGDRTLSYVDRMAGTFTLGERAQGFRSVLMVGTGTGLAPFVSMLKQIDHEVQIGGVPQVRYTLIHTNRTSQELAYHEDLLKIQAARRFDFLYVPSVSRPTEADRADSRLGRGRANNLLRYVFGMPLREELDLQQARTMGEDAAAKSRSALDRVTAPALPEHIRRDALLERLDPLDTMLLTCGNPLSVADIKLVAAAQRMRIETEAW
jgi:ferredoxin-NADP reductase